MTQQPTAAAMRAAKIINTGAIHSNITECELTYARDIDCQTHLPELIAFVKEWRSVLDFANDNYGKQFCHEADQLLKQAEG